MRGLIGSTPDPGSDLPIDIDGATDRATQTENFPRQHARYLRIQCYKRITGWGVSMWSLSVLDTASPGTDLALGKTATASSADNGSDQPGNAVDGNPATRWSSAYEDNQWIQVDLGSAVSFDQVVIVWELADALNYAIQVSSDGTTWTDVKTVLDGGPWFLHDWCTQGNQAVDTYQAAIETRLGTAASLADFCAKAQFVNYESIRAMFEAWNTKLWNDASGLMLWMSNPAHHSTVWQTYDYDLDVNGTYYGARKGCEAVHVQASLTDWQVLVANHTAEQLTGPTVTAELYDLTGASLAAPQTQAVTVAPSSTAPVFTADFGAALPSPHLLRLRLTGQQNQLLSENVYWRYRAASDMQALDQLPQVPVSASVHDSGGGQDSELDRLPAQQRPRGRGHGRAVAAGPAFGPAGPAHAIQRELPVAAAGRDQGDHAVVAAGSGDRPAGASERLQRACSARVTRPRRDRARCPGRCIRRGVLPNGLTALPRISVLRKCVTHVRAAFPRKRGRGQDAGGGRGSLRLLSTAPAAR